ncbi:hypothetical protein PY365_29655 [Roseiarcaceae bacterium H3SJ34-1]|uniref:hypothetical protein n=1 Tax=Terripilifer ovatus TaxID=3032367 RepID=UPI003AB9748D|nr:hypothetical protein [Roseiarcaceae bacterium H3SJ34-1]
MPTPIENARKRLAEIRAEAAEIERFIEFYKRFEDEPDANQVEAAATPTGGNLSTETVVQVVDKSRRRSDRTGPTPSEIAQVMERVIRDVGRPMTRGEIVEALERRDIEIQAQDKYRYVGTLAWRHKSIFINVEGRGYWLRSERMPAGRRLLLPDDPPEETSDELPLSEVGGE